MTDVSARQGDVRRGIGAVSQAILLVFLAFFAGFVLAYLVGTAAVAVGVVSRDGLLFSVVLSVAQFLGFGVGVAAFFALYDEWDLLKVRRPTLLDLGWIGAGVVLILLAAFAIEQVLTALDVQTAQNQVIATGERNPVFFLYMVPVTILLVGPFEELVFRAGAQGLLRRAFGPATAIAIASGLFGVAHWIALTGGGSRVSYIAIAAGLGLILGYLYERTQNVVVPAAVHGTYNAVLFLIQYAVATGVVS